MTKKTKERKSKNKSVKKKKTSLKKSKRVKKVWKIFRFEHRFELSDDVRFCRKSPLLYTRSYVGSGQDNEAISYQQQMRMLCTKPNSLALRGAFDILKETAANRSRCYRGYLLDERLEPASEKKISQWLNISIKEARQILADLEDVVLIEKVPIPEFDPSMDDPPAEKPDQKKDDKSKAGRHGKSKKPAKRTKKRDKQSNLERARDSTRQLERAREPLRAKTERKDKGKTAIGNKKINEKVKPASAKPQPAKSHPNPDHHPADSAEKKKENKNKSAISTVTGTELRFHRHDGTQKKTTSAPTTTPPLLPNEPLEADAPGDCDYSGYDPPGSDNNKDTNRRLERLYDPQCKEFAAAIYRALRVPYLPGTVESHRELGNFASAWAMAQKAGIPPSGLERLWERSVKSARQIGNNRRRRTYTKSPEAVWRYQFNKRLASMEPKTATG